MGQDMGSRHRVKTSGQRKLSLAHLRTVAAAINCLLQNLNQMHGFTATHFCLTSYVRVSAMPGGDALECGAGADQRCLAQVSRDELKRDWQSRLAETTR